MKNRYLLILLCFTVFTAKAQIEIIPEEAANHIGKIVTVCGKVSGARYLENTATKPTLLNIGADFPNHFLTILIRDEDRRNFSKKPELQYLNKNICVTGKLIDYKGKPEIAVVNPSEIQIKDEVVDVEGRPEIKDRVATNERNNTPGTTIENQIPPTTPIKKAPVATPAAKPEVSSYTIEITSEVNLREGPSLTDKIVTVVKAGTAVNIYKSGNGWSYVSVKPEGDDKSALVYGYMKNSVIK